MDELDIQVNIGLLDKNITYYKVSPYKSFDYFVSLRDSYKERKHWSGIYLAKDRKTSYGYRFDYDHAYGHLVQILHKMNVVICSGSYLESGGNSGDDKARGIIDILPNDIKRYFKSERDLLIPTLGKLGYCYQGPADEEGGIEVIIPEALAIFVYMRNIIDFGPSRYL
ncbi:hypothetical protein M8994_10100 [Brucella sp. 21LCYQ03]|nr:hypothetical protein [Brucella sp. 21LCYQ03]